MLTAIIFYLVSVAGFFVAGLLIGDHFATKETEKRWSDAVEKAEWHRKYGTI